MGVAAQLMGVSERHTWRLLAAYRKEGASAIAHGNRGRRPSTTTDTPRRQRVRELAAGPYAGLNHTHLTEMLSEREGIDLSRSTVRRILLAAGVRSPRPRRASRRYSRRERYPQEGMLLQVDGSRHNWLLRARPLPDVGRSRGRCHRKGPGRPVQAARGRPGLSVDAQGGHRAPRCPLGPVQRQARHLPALPKGARELRRTTPGQA